jgi:hypothetical protein
VEKMIKYNRMPLDFNGITESYEGHVSRGSRGEDLGWHDYQGEPVYAINDGTVMQVGSSTGNNNAGNYIWIKHEFDEYDLWSRYCHLAGFNVSQGQIVSRGQQIATMGGTFGYATHLHFELWKVPKGWSFNFGDRTTYAVKGTDYTFLFDNQAKASDTSLTKVIGTSLQDKKDTLKDQIEVVGWYLRVRDSANGNILGYVDFGLYDYFETKEEAGYVWYRIGDSIWIAGVEGDVNVYPKESGKKEELEKKVEELTLENNTLKQQIIDLQKELAEAKKLPEGYVSFEATKDGYFYKKMVEKEVLYYK